MEDEKVEEGLFVGRMGSPEKGRGTRGEKYVPAMISKRCFVY